MKMLTEKSVRDEITALLLQFPELDEDEILRADMIEGETQAFAFLSQIIRKIGSNNALLDGTIAYVKDLQERIGRLERRDHALRKLIHKIMDTADIRKAELPEATISIRAGTPKVVVVNEHEIPRDFLRVKTEPDKTKIKAALQAHEHVPGCALSNGEPTLAIRTT